ncbi:MAG: ABC transporter permease, partial [Candidatus Margulisbacteria bacterium]|nr:ABC transporter permease [Candidatus Margulisiibacteriota bacterium]
MFARLGKKVIAILEEIGEISILIWTCFIALFQRKLHMRNFIEQAARLGFDSLPIALITLFFVGMVFAIQTAREFLRYGAMRVVGGVIGISLWREMAPALGAVVFAARVGASITAELGTMKVTEQIDSLRSMGVNYVSYLIIPRFWAASFVMPLLVILADVVGLLGGFLVANLVYNINATVFFDSAQNLLSMSDIYGGLLKAVVFGMLIAAISCYKGITTTGGAKGVGEYTTQSVVTSLIVIFILNYF